MLLQIKIKNYYSFKEEVIFSMEASNDQEKENNTIQYDNKRRLLKTVAILGANGSGKSNFIKSISFITKLVRNSSKETSIGDEIDVEPFLLSDDTENEPSFFEVVFLHNNIKHRYGFEVNNEYVVKEWLYSTYTIKESKMFVRNYDEPIDVGVKFKEIKKFLNMEGKIRNNTLLLSFAAHMGVIPAMDIVEWFNSIIVLDGSDYPVSTAIEILEGNNDVISEQMKSKFINILRYADIGIEDLYLSKKRYNVKDVLDQLPAEMRDKFLESNLESDEIMGLSPKVIHNKYDANNEKIGTVEFDIIKESKGTKALFALLGPIIHLLYKGGILFIDEIDTSLHPLLIAKIFELIQSEEDSRGQLVFTTHGTNIIASKIFRRDQLVMVNKDEYGRSSMESLKGMSIR